MSPLIEQYLASLHLRADGLSSEGETADELRAHLEDAINDLQMAGLPPLESAAEALRRFGSADELTAAFAQQYRSTRRRLRSLIGVGLVAAAFAVIGGGVASAHSSEHTTPQHVTSLSQPRTLSIVKGR